MLEAYCCEQSCCTGELVKTVAELAQDEPAIGVGSNGDVILRLSGLDVAKRAWRKGALRYAARTLTRLGYRGAAVALEIEALQHDRPAQLARGTCTDVEQVADASITLPLDNSQRCG